MSKRTNLEVEGKTLEVSNLDKVMYPNCAVTYEQTKAFALAVAQRLEVETPDQVVSRMAKNLRRRKVFVDWSQNDEHKTTINVYSLRAKAFPSVSTPVSWKEVEGALKPSKSTALIFDASTILKRVEKMGDLFAPVLALKQKLPKFE